MANMWENRVQLFWERNLDWLNICFVVFFKKESKKTTVLEGFWVRKMLVLKGTARTVSKDRNWAVRKLWCLPTVRSDGHLGQCHHLPCDASHSPRQHQSWWEMGVNQYPLKENNPRKQASAQISFNLAVVTHCFREHGNCCYIETWSILIIAWLYNSHW